MKSQTKSQSTMPEWQRQLRTAFRSTTALLEYLHLDARNSPYELSCGRSFPLRVPIGLADRMRKGDWFDPLLLQVLPRKEEGLEHPGFTDDAVGDAQAVKAPGLLHKYTTRVLILASPSCAMHCRYCFRRRMPRHAFLRSTGDITATCRYIAQHTEVEEVILSGGDPLLLSNHRLDRLFSALIAVPHVRTVRIHTRAPVTLPSRVDTELVDMLWSLNRSVTCVVVIHANIAQEIDEKVSDALSALRTTGAIMLNQSVLLKGINDSAEALAALSKALVSNGVLPYYLHQLDRARGTGHFEVDEPTGRSLMARLRALLPGYAVPRYVREIAGEQSKMPLEMG
jgi:L-lysine 2,3-aminomutase